MTWVTGPSAPVLNHSTLLIGLFWQDHLGYSLTVTRPGFPCKESQLGFASAMLDFYWLPRICSHWIKPLNAYCVSRVRILSSLTVLIITFCGLFWKLTSMCKYSQNIFFFKLDLSSLCLVEWSLVCVWENVLCTGTWADIQAFLMY